ncbi:hypothetical protein, partial [Brucella intermedia]|uniref:hypothetical protein n=1 Tax=Brucella intermedia TaxID=94625 RepID=UPI001AED8B47
GACCCAVSAIKANSQTDSEMLSEVRDQNQMIPKGVFCLLTIMLVPWVDQCKRTIQWYQKNS